MNWLVYFNTVSALLNLGFYVTYQQPINLISAMFGVACAVWSYDNV